MQRAGHSRPSPFCATVPTPVAARSAPVISVRLLDELTLPDETASNSFASGDVARRRAAQEAGAAQVALEIAIRQRIETRLNGRVRNLNVRASADLVILEGQCSTYYSKQLAQHAAMGILEDEHLENSIVVSVEQ